MSESKHGAEGEVSEVVEPEPAASEPESESGSEAASEPVSDSDSASSSGSEPESGSALESGSASGSESGSESGSGSESESESESGSADEPGGILDARPLAKAGDYPEADERELRMAGVGCMGLVLGGSLVIGIVFFVAFQSINDLGGGSPTATVVSEAAPREPVEPRTEPASRPEPLVDWLEPTDGRELAEAEGRPMVVFFEAAWAQASQDMREGTFEDPSIVAALEPFVVVRVDMAAEDPGSVALRDAHEVTFVPHVLFLGPEGEPLRPGAGGLVAPDDLRVLLSDALALHRERSVTPPEGSGSDDGEPPTTPATPASDERP